MEVYGQMPYFGQAVKVGDSASKWYHAAAKTRCAMFSFFYFALAVATAIVFVYGLKSLHEQRVRNFRQVGLSGPNPHALFIGTNLSYNMGNVISVALLINLPKCLFSMLYFLVNVLVTMMHTSNEWALITKHRKALRVSNPRGEQSSTYWLQLPWSYSVPLIIASVSLHWLLGRSVYLVKVDVYGHLGKR